MRDGETITAWLDRWFVPDPSQSRWKSPSGITHEKPAISADGVRLEKGMTVWVAPEHARDCGKCIDKTAGLGGIGYGMAVKVEAVRPIEIVLLDTCGAWCPASWLTTKEPDTQERIDADAKKTACAYFDRGYATDACDGCPADCTGFSCKTIMTIDLLRRQRELDAAMAGGDA